MVQRKAPSKLGIRADQAKPDKYPAYPKSSSQHQDGHKNRGCSADLKKKMKKSSKPAKLPDSRSLRSSPPSRPDVRQPGKPPPQPPGKAPTVAPMQQKKHVPTNAAASPPLKQPSPMRTSSDGSPNYMKPTSSSDARKERLQVSNRNSLSPDSKNLSRRNANGAKSTKTLTRTSSLKRVRNLTKTPSFKPARASSKKCSQAAICADINVQRATCSSTLKDSKFPECLTLSPEGTSVLKVCPYTYCSLNGHHHALLPPLKCFMLARRRLLKTQKSVKLGSLSPRRARVTDEDSKEDTVPFQLEDLSSPAAPPVAPEVDMDFFVEIYTKEREGVPEKTEHAEVENEINFAGELCDLDYSASSLGESDETEPLDGAETRVSVLREPRHSEKQNEHCVEQNSDGSLTNMGMELLDDAETRASILREPQHSEKEFEYSVVQKFHSSLTNVGMTKDSEQDDQEVEETDDNGSVFEVTDMDWDGEQYSDYLGYGDQDALLSDNDTDLKCTLLSEIVNLDMNNEPILEPDNNKCKLQDKITVEIQQGSSEEERDGAAGPVEKPVELVAAEEGRNGVSEAEIWTSSVERQILDEKYIFNGFLAEACPQDEQKDLSLHIVGFSQREIHEDESNQMEEVYQLDAIDGGGRNGPGFANDNLFIKTENDLLDKNDEGSYPTENQNPSDTDQTETESLKISSSMANEEHDESGVNKSSLIECSSEYVNCNKEENEAMSEIMLPSAGKTSKQEQSDACKKYNVRYRGQRSISEEERRKFNPREPNFLPLEPDPGAERVDLRHQTVDERKNAEEWMLDYAIQQAVTKLAPARKRKVALLVEAFETVMPTQNYETHPRHPPAVFAHARPIQACS